MNYKLSNAVLLMMTFRGKRNSIYLFKRKCYNNTAIRVHPFELIVLHYSDVGPWGGGEREVGAALDTSDLTAV